MTQHQFSLFNIMNPNQTPGGQKPNPKKSSASANPAVSKKLKKEPTAKEITPHPRIAAWDKVYEMIVENLRSFFAANNFKRGVLGVSGGIDSALTLKISADALGAENVCGLIMPELGVTKDENIDHAKALCEFLGVNNFYVPINNFLVDFRNLPWNPKILASMNVKARMRTVLLYNYANSENALVLGTSNKSEILLGYGTKYGDFAADVEVIGDLFKTEVIQLADSIGLPPEIVFKTPSAELSSSQTDEQDLGATYEDLDKVLMKKDLGMEGCVEHGLPPSLVQSVFRRMGQNRHKNELPFIINAHLK